MCRKTKFKRTGEIQYPEKSEMNGPMSPVIQESRRACHHFVPSILNLKEPRLAQIKYISNEKAQAEIDPAAQHKHNYTSVTSKTVREPHKYLCECIS